MLGVTLVCEVLLLSALGLSVLFKGGPDGFMAADTVNPVAAFTSLPEGAFGTGVAGTASARLAAACTASSARRLA